MANLFFIHTPLELLVAQQVINYEKLKDNVMLYGYQGTNSHYTKVYSLIKIDGFWKKTIGMDDVDVWASLSRRNFCFSLKRLRSRYFRIKKIVEENSIRTIFLGDLNNTSCKFASVAFNQLGIKCCFFEEGTGHYNYVPIYANKALFPINFLYGVAADLLFYLPVCGLRFGAYCFWKDLRFDKLPIHIRYSIRPFYHESYDKWIHIEPLISKQLKMKLDEEISVLNTDNAILFLNAPIYHVAHDDRKAIEAYYDLLVTYFKKVPKNYSIYIKFHPSDGEKEKRKIIDIVEWNGLCYTILSRDINIPVEYYLQYQQYKEIVTFFSATIFYNGYLFPSRKFVSLLYLYYEYCKSKSISSLEKLYSIVETENQLMKNDPHIVRYIA